VSSQVLEEKIDFAAERFLNMTPGVSFLNQPLGCRANSVAERFFVKK
jgi:hypothetical protein